MKRLTVEKPVNEMDMTELAHNCMFAKNRWAWHRDYEGEKDLMELIREINVVIGGSELPENNTLLEEVLQDNLQYSLSDKDGLIAFIYQSLWTKANLRERLKEYEDTDLAPEQIAELKKNHGLPCKVGDIIYSDSEYFGILSYEVNSVHICIGISFEAIASREDEMLDAIDFDIEDIGKTVFLTREEAESKLAEMEGANETN